MIKDELDSVLGSVATRLNRTDDERWSFTAHGVPMQCFSSTAKDRMRVIAAVAYVDQVAPEQLPKLLEASFHSDARYAIHDDTVFAAFLHPLARLTATELLEGVRQVAKLARTFGTRFAAGPLKFQWPRPRPEPSGIRRRTVEAVQQQLARARGGAERPPDVD